MPARQRLLGDMPPQKQGAADDEGFVPVHPRNFTGM
jgi:hypothetical protein